MTLIKHKTRRERKPMSLDNKIMIVVAVCIAIGAFVEVVV